LGSKATAGVEAGELKLNPPADADVDDCNITTNINLFERNIKIQILVCVISTILKKYINILNIYKIYIKYI